MMFYIVYIYKDTHWVLLVKKVINRNYERFSEEIKEDLDII